MTAPAPVPGVNPWTLAYQTEQFDKGISAGQPHAFVEQSVFNALNDPPAAGVTAEASPDILFAENTDPVDQSAENLPGS